MFLNFPTVSFPFLPLITTERVECLVLRVEVNKPKSFINSLVTSKTANRNKM